MHTFLFLKRDQIFTHVLKLDKDKNKCFINENDVGVHLSMMDVTTELI